MTEEEKLNLTKRFLQDEFSIEFRFIEGLEKKDFIVKEWGNELTIKAYFNEIIYRHATEKELNLFKTEKFFNKCRRSDVFLEIMNRCIREEIKIKRSETEKIIEDLASDYLEENKNEERPLPNKDFSTKKELIGFSEIKKELEEIILIKKSEEKLKKLNIKTENKQLNIFITGNPGTGKTTIAEYIADQLFENGVLEKKVFIENKVSDLIGKHVGHTSPKVKQNISKAKGGVYFLDEAYRLADGRNKSSDGGSYNKEALETIMECMDEYPETVFIFAGYEEKMKELFEVNEGFESRINFYFHLKDYTQSELIKIAKSRITSLGYGIKEAEKELERVLSKKIGNKSLKGNARTINKICENIIKNHNIRVIQDNSLSKEDIVKISPEDIKKLENEFYSVEDIKNSKLVLEEAKIELNNLIGLSEIKKVIANIEKEKVIKEKRKKFNLKTQKSSYHMFLMGNPGTGKTTLARILGKIYRGLGILKKGHFIETTKKDLLGNSSNIQQNVSKIVNKAKDGILFIDEAYSIANDGLGKEILDCLIKEMEDKREELIVIFAGYENEMQKLFTLNPGLKSRVPYELMIDDYNNFELYSIIKENLEREDYTLSKAAGKTLLQNIQYSIILKETTSNGRWARNISENIKSEHSRRIFDHCLGESLEDLTTIEVKDIEKTFENLINAKKENTEKEKSIV